MTDVRYYLGENAQWVRILEPEPDRMKTLFQCHNKRERNLASICPHRPFVSNVCRLGMTSGMSFPRSVVIYPEVHEHEDMLHHGRSQCSCEKEHR